MQSFCQSPVVRGVIAHPAETRHRISKQAGKSPSITNHMYMYVCVSVDVKRYIIRRIRNISSTQWLSGHTIFVVVSARKIFAIRENSNKPLLHQAMPAVLIAILFVGTSKLSQALRILSWEGALFCGDKINYSLKRIDRQADRTDNPKYG